MTLLRRAEPVIRPLMRAYFRLRRSMTLGARGVVLDEDGRVLLVEHTYSDGWHLPGGGVERGETCEAAMRRELEEEAGVRAEGPLRLIAVDNNEKLFRGDHVLVHRVERWRPCPSNRVGEISQVGWFEPHALPERTTADTRRRVAAALAWPEPHPG